VRQRGSGPTLLAHLACPSLGLEAKTRRRSSSRATTILSSFVIDGQLQTETDPAVLLEPYLE
jgi:hypothetical protein